MAEAFAERLSAVAYLMLRFGTKHLALRFFSAASKLAPNEASIAEGIQRAGAPASDSLIELNSYYPTTLVRTLSQLAQRRCSIDTELWLAALSSSCLLYTSPSPRDRG